MGILRGLLLPFVVATMFCAALCQAGPPLPPEDSVFADPVAIEFPATKIGSTVTDVVRLRNIGTESRQIRVYKYDHNCPIDGGYCLPSFAGLHDFSFTENCTGILFRPGQSCEIRISFSPTGSGLRRSNFQVDTYFRQVASISVRGEGLPVSVPATDLPWAFLLSLLLSLVAARHLAREHRHRPHC